MNKDRRKTLQTLLEQIEILRDSLDAVKEDEEEYRDNIPENLQGSERYERAETACDNLYEAVSSLEVAITSIESAVE